jgi:hypothetical protein
MRMFRLPAIEAAIVALALSLGSSAVGQSDAPPGPMSATFWTGRWTFTGGEPGIETSRPGYTEVLGAIVRGDVAADDPRMVGTWTQVYNFHSAAGEGSGDGEVGISNGRVRIDSEDGAWVGTMAGYGGGRPVSPQEWYVLEGEGAFDGLTTVFRFDGDDSSLEGVIFPSALPALPEPLPAPADPASAASQSPVTGWTSPSGRTMT